MDRRALGEYLRSRREHLDPAAFGIPSGGRRTPGLRRSEIAERAVVSEIHYANIEQGRGSRPSPEVLVAITRAMRLPRQEVQHVFALAGELAPRATAPDAELGERTRLLLTSVGDLPALVCSARFDVLGQNPAAVALLGDLCAEDGRRRNLARRHFLPDAEDESWGAPNHAAFSRFAAAGLRDAITRYPQDADTQELVEELSLRSEEFRRTWEREPVGLLDGDELDQARVFIGDRIARCDVTLIPDRDQYLIFLTPEPPAD